MMPSEIAAQPVPNTIARHASTERTAIRTTPRFRAGSTSDGVSGNDIRGPAERPKDGASSNLRSVAFPVGSRAGKSVPDKRLDATNGVFSADQFSAGLPSVDQSGSFSSAASSPWSSA
jgi:hypothetical protein